MMTAEADRSALFQRFLQPVDLDMLIGSGPLNN
jgi:hypothetical protein